LKGTAPSLLLSIGLRWVGWQHMPSPRTATRVLGVVAIIATTLTLAALIAGMLFAPMLP
jgi:hypothetical protein